MVGAKDVAALGGIFFQELDSEVTETGGTEFLEISGACLRDGVEEGIPAADIGAEWVLHSDTVAQVDTMGLAGTAAVGVILAFGKEGGEDAVLHVKHRHVLMDRELEPFRRSGLQKIKHLGHIQVVADSRPLQSLIDEELCGQGVRHIQ